MINLSAVFIVLIIIILWVSSRKGGPIHKLKKHAKQIYRRGATKLRPFASAHYFKDRVRPQFVKSEYAIENRPEHNPPACINEVDGKWERVAAKYDHKYGTWKCDFFDLGDSRFPNLVGQPVDGEPHVMCLARDGHRHRDDGKACGWGSFGDNSLVPLDIGKDADGVISGYRLVPIKEDQSDNLFKRFPNIDASNVFSKGYTYGIKNETADDVGQCETRCVEADNDPTWDIDAKDCYGYVYDPTTTTCDLYRNLDTGEPVNKQLRNMM